MTRLALSLAMVLVAACATTTSKPTTKPTTTTRAGAAHTHRARSTTAAATDASGAGTKDAAGAGSKDADETHATTSNAAAGDEDNEPVEEGLASYYADELAGNPTASGERYRPERATCAHRTQSYGTVLEVTAVGSGRKARCRVNDRGPFVDDRVLDVSKKVARALGMVDAGVLRVRVKVAWDQDDPD